MMTYQRVFPVFVCLTSVLSGIFDNVAFAIPAAVNPPESVYTTVPQEGEAACYLFENEAVTCTRSEADLFALQQYWSNIVDWDDVWGRMYFNNGIPETFCPPGGAECMNVLVNASQEQVILYFDDRNFRQFSQSEYTAQSNSLDFQNVYSITRVHPQERQMIYCIDFPGNNPVTCMNISLERGTVMSVTTWYERESNWR
jgi:hypothetical protein